ncbi:MAG: endonuclease/exonuclease/phosphatase family protein, partial [Paracoccaceae bacterium]
PQRRRRGPPESSRGPRATPTLGPGIRQVGGGAGGLGADALVVVAGDLNADPEDGDGIRGEIRSLLGHPRLQDPRPESLGGAEAARFEETPKTGDPALHTADWPEGRGKPGNLRVDYVLPDARLEVVGAGVFWPARGAPLARLVRMGRSPASSDHRLVWVDLVR